MNNTLITGHEGLLGGALFDRIRADGYDRGYGFPDQKYDLIIHTAANCSIRQVIENPHQALENIYLTHRVYELARKFGSRVVAFSSGRVPHESFNPYTVSKRYTEETAKAYQDCYGVESMIIRPETVWGVSKNPERVVMKWIEAAKQDRDLIIYGPKDKELPPIHVDEFTTIVLGLIENFKPETYSVAGQIRKAEDIAESIITQTNSRSAIVFREPETTQPQKCIPADYVSDVNFETSLNKHLNETTLDSDTL